MLKDPSHPLIALEQDIELYVKELASLILQSVLTLTHLLLTMDCIAADLMKGLKFAAMMGYWPWMMHWTVVWMEPISLVLMEPARAVQ